MKIIQATCYYPPHVGGVENHVMELTKALTRQDNELLVITSNIPKCEDDTCMRLKAKEIFPRYIPLISGLSKINTMEADIFHSHCPPPFLSKAICKANKKPHVLTYHFDLEVPKTVGHLRIPRRAGASVEKIYKKHYALQVADDSDAIIVTGKSYAETSPILSQFLYKCHVIPNGIDTQKFDRAIQSMDIRRKKNVLFVGRLVHPKGVHYLIKAMRQVVRAVPEARLVIVGDGEERKNLTNLVLKLGLEGVVEFKGFVSFKELVKSYLEASVFVLPSFTRLENFGIVLLEAMACRTPVIASDIPGVRENIANGNGLLFTPRDVDGLANAIIHIISDEKKVKRMGGVGRKLIEEKYDWTTIAEQVLTIYNKLVC
jgi:glycosyltransferase involved in cell wall biosynthesis